VRKRALRLDWPLIDFALPMLPDEIDYSLVAKTIGLSETPAYQAIGLLSISYRHSHISSINSLNHFTSRFQLRVSPWIHAGI
jgi:hypothetical protein